MLVIKHRVNTISELLATPKEFGVEVDIRPYKDTLILHHDPFIEGESLEEYLKNFSHRFIILELKSEGIENRVIELAEKFGIADYFLLSAAPPAMRKLMNREFTKFAVRFSDMESVETCKFWAGKADWVWVDIFRDFPLDEQTTAIMKKNFKICTISPEVIGLRGALERYRGKMRSLGIDAVCTDLPDLWK